MKRQVARAVTRALTIAVGAVLAIGIAAGSLWPVGVAVRQGVAFASLTAASAQQQTARMAIAPAAEALAAQATIAERATTLANRLIEAAGDGYVGAVEKTDLIAATEALNATIELASPFDPDEAPPAIRDYSVEALADTEEEVRRDTESLTGAADDVEALTGELSAQTDALAAAAVAVFASAKPLERSLEAVSWVATVDAKLAVREQLALVTDAGFDAAGVDAMQRYVGAIHAMEAAHEAELASFAGPLYDNRVAALAFANSISGEVLIEFDWVPELFGFGSGYGMAAQATLEGDGTNFYSTITLTNNVASRFGDGGPEGIIAHEVGHALTSKCMDLFNAVAGGDYEAFATAWAIGMGYTNSSNGTTAYGRPSDELVAATMSCR